MGLIGINIPFMRKTDFRVDLSPFRHELPDILATNPNGIEVVRTVQESSAGGIVAEHGTSETETTAPEESEKESD
jgi:hypothetical protein